MSDAEIIAKLERERDQLIKVCDELVAATLRHSGKPEAGQERKAIVAYNNLPHVKERKCTCGEPHISDMVVHGYNGKPCYIKER